MFERLDPLQSPSSRTQKARSFDELVGLCRGILCDGMLVKGEADFLLQWLQSHDVIHFHEDVAHLVNRLADALQDGVIDADEERDLLEAIMGIAMPVDLPPWEFIQAQRERPAAPSAQSLIAALPFMDSSTELSLRGATVVVTGVFKFGPRDAVANALRCAGAIVGQNFTRSTRYLVVGTLGSADWKTTSAGTKITAAISAKAAGQAVDLVSEAHLFGQLGV
jgi:NAD-dependent DNA ligase